MSVYGELDAKIERISKLYSLSPDKAKKLIKDTDKKRAINYKYYAERDWGVMKNYALCLSTTDLGIDKCVDLICAASSN